MTVPTPAKSIRATVVQVAAVVAAAAAIAAAATTIPTQTVQVANENGEASGATQLL